MPTADAPLQRITINIYLDDYLFLKDRYGNYQEIVREWIKMEIKAVMRTDQMIEEEEDV